MQHIMLSEETLKHLSRQPVKNIMRLLILFTFLIFGISYSQAQFRTLKDFQWENRLLIIYADDQKSSYLQEQLTEIIQKQEDYNERNLKVIILKNQKVEIWKSNENQLLDFHQITKKLKIDTKQSYQNLLIGKDGGVKLKSSVPISNAKLFETIDAMPMRQREMRDGH